MLLSRIILSLINQHKEPLSQITQIGEIRIERYLLRQLLLLQEHEHIDRVIGDPPCGLDVAAAEDAAFFDAVILVIHHVVHGVVAVVILAGLDLDGQNPSGFLN